MVTPPNPCLHPMDLLLFIILILWLKSRQRKGCLERAVEWQEKKVVSSG